MKPEQHAEPKTQDCNCAAIRQAARHVTQLYDNALAGTGLRAPQYSLLSKIRRKGPMTINALAAELVMDRTTLSRNLAPLERDGLVSIKPNASDRRSKELHLTKGGRDRLGKADARWNEAQRTFEKSFGKKRSASLRTELTAVIDNVQSDLTSNNKSKSSSSGSDDDDRAKQRDA